MVGLPDQYNVAASVADIFFFFKKCNVKINNIANTQQSRACTNRKKIPNRFDNKFTDNYFSLK